MYRSQKERPIGLFSFRRVSQKQKITIIEVPFSIYKQRNKRQVRKYDEMLISSGNSLMRSLTWLIFIHLESSFILIFICPLTVDNLVILSFLF